MVVSWSRLRYLRRMEQSARVAQDDFDVAEWNDAMESAANDICELGRQLVASHRKTGDRAEEVLRNWNLEERLVEEREALACIFRAGRRVLEQLRLARDSMQPDLLRESAEVIEQSLTEIENAFLVVRQCAQDLLHWVQRFAPVEGSDLPARYRSSYGRLTAYSPVLKPRLEAFQQDLLNAVNSKDGSIETRALLSAITRYNGTLETARRFVRAVVEPPLDLVFLETGEFIEEMQCIPLDSRASLASSLNDCCQSLQYERANFDRQVTPVSEHRLAEGESSLVVFADGNYRVLLTFEEDPIFDRMTVHLLRVVEVRDFKIACETVSRALQEEWE